MLFICTVLFLDDSFYLCLIYFQVESDLQFNQNCPLCGAVGLSRVDKHIKLGFCMLLQHAGSDSERESLSLKGLAEIVPANRLQPECNCILCKSVFWRVESVLCKRERMEGRRKRVQYKLRLYCDDESSESDFEERMVEGSEMVKCRVGRALLKRIQRDGSLAIESAELLGPVVSKRPKQLAERILDGANVYRSPEKRFVKRQRSPLPQVTQSSEQSIEFSSLDCNAVSSVSDAASPSHITPRPLRFVRRVSPSSDKVQAQIAPHSIHEISDSQPSKAEIAVIDDRFRKLGRAKSQQISADEKAKIFLQFDDSEVYDCGGAGDCGPLCISAFLQWNQIEKHSHLTVRNCIADQCNCKLNCNQRGVWWSDMCLATCARVYQIRIIVIEMIPSSSGASGNDHILVTSYWPSGEPNGMQFRLFIVFKCNCAILTVFS